MHLSFIASFQKTKMRLYKTNADIYIVCVQETKMRLPKTNTDIHMIFYHQTLHRCHRASAEQGSNWDACLT